jgi:hypothetical protein
LGPNIELRERVRELAKRISVVDSKISAKVLSRLEELVLPFDRISKVHETLEQIEEMRNSLATP